MNTFKQVLFAFLFSAIYILPVQASDRPTSDTDKEQRWANQIVDFLIEGESQWLQAGEQRFLSIYTPSAVERPKGAVVLLHGRGVHPDWPQVIQPLRTQLPQKGWATLSIQLPVLPNKAGLEEYVPLFEESPVRIKAALDFLEQRGFKNIVLMGHSLGNNMATDFLAHSRDKRVQAFVGVSMEAARQPKKFEVLDNVVGLFQVKVPVLDIYGSEAIEPVIKSVDRRAYVIYQALNKKSRQIEIKGANHFFQGFENELVQTITLWLDKATLISQSSKKLVKINQ